MFGWWLDEPYLTYLWMPFYSSSASCPSTWSARSASQTCTLRFYSTTSGCTRSWTAARCRRCWLTSKTPSCTSIRTLLGLTPSMYLLENFFSSLFFSYFRFSFIFVSLFFKINVLQQNIWHVSIPSPVKYLENGTLCQTSLHEEYNQRKSLKRIHF